MADSSQNCCAENCYFGVTNHRGNFIAVHPYYIGNFLRLVEILHRHLGGRLKMTLRVPAAQSGPLRFPSWRARMRAIAIFWTTP